MTDLVPQQQAPAAAPPAAPIPVATKPDLTAQIVRILQASRAEASKANRTHALPGLLLVAGLALAFCGPVLAALRVPRVDWFTPSVGIAGYVCGSMLAIVGGLLGLLSHVLPVKWDDETRQGAVKAAVTVEQERVKAETRQRESDEAYRRLLLEQNQEAGQMPSKAD